MLPGPNLCTVVGKISQKLGKKCLVHPANSEYPGQYWYGGATYDVPRLAAMVSVTDAVSRLVASVFPSAQDADVECGRVFVFRPLFLLRRAYGLA